MDRPQYFKPTLVTVLFGVLAICVPSLLWGQAGPSQWFDCQYLTTTQCDGTVPSLFVDLRNDPSQKWYSCKLGRGQKDSTCCNIIIGNNDQCIEFKVLVHPQTQAILLQVPESSEQEWQDDVAWYDANFPQPPNPPSPPSPGAKPSINTYRINCGPLQGGAQGDEPACLTSSVLNDTIFITFCQTGNNDNVYRIKTIRAELIPDVEILAEGCGNSLTVSSTDIDVSSITWDNVNVPPNPIYNSYLSTTCCDTTITVTVPKGAPLPPGNPPVLLYEMCADPIGAGFCPSLAQICTTVQVQVLSPPDIIVNAPTVCPEGIFFAEVTNGTAGLEYTWYDGPDATGGSFFTGTTDNYTFSSHGNKSVVVVDPTIQAVGYDQCAYDTVNFLIDTFPTPLAEINGPTEICVLVPYNFTATNDGLGQSYNWNFGSGASPASYTGTNSPGRNPPAVQWSTCGNKTIRLIVTSANGCRDTTFHNLTGDTEDPVITCPPTVTIECDQIPTPALTGQATATDNCGVYISFTDNILPGPCPGEYTIERTWVATDSCGNSDQCLQLINVVDTEPPVVTCVVTDLVLECDQNYTAEINTWINNTINDLYANASDNCGTITIVDDWNGALPTLDCNGSTGLTVTFTISDDCNNDTTCTGLIIIDDTQPPVVNCNANDLILECGDDYLALINSWIATTEADLLSAATDACGGPLTVTNDWDNVTVPTIDCNGTTGLTITFTVFDACLNPTPCQADIILTDTEPPVVNCNIPNLVLECDQDYISEISSWIATVEASLESTSSDVCSSSLTAGNLWNGSDVPTLDCDGVTGLTVTFTVTDDCGNVTLCDALVTVDDTTPPVVTCNVSDLILECDQDYNQEIIDWLALSEANLLSVAVDDCNQPLTADNDWDGTLPILDCSGTSGVTVVFTVIDGCGNVTPCPANIYVIDTEPPIVNCVTTDLVLECDQDYLTEIQNWINITEADILAASSDDCGQTLTITNDWNGTDVPTLDCDGVTGLTVTFTVLDACLNPTTCPALVIIDDTTPPTVSFPGDYGLNGCDVTAITDLPFSLVELIITLGQFQGLGGSVTETCNSSFTITYQDSIIAICPLMVRRLFRVTDECGNQTVGPQIITITDNIPPSIQCPGLITGEGCGPADVGSVTGFDFATDTTVIDPADFIAIDFVSFVSDNCGIRELNYIDAIIQQSCPLQIERTFTVYDSCGLTNSCVSLITIQDTQAPTITCPADVVNEGCDVSAIQTWTTLAFSTTEQIIDEITFDNLDGPSEAFDICGILEVRYSDVIVQLTCPLLVDRTFTAYDSCGLNSSCTQRIEIQDTEAPTITCPDDASGEGCDISAVLGISGLSYSSVEVVIDEVTFDNLDGASEAFDVCGILEVRYSDVIVQPSCPLLIDRTFTAYDSCGLNTSCVQRITVEDTQVPQIICPGPIDGEGCDVTAIAGLSSLPFATSSTLITESQFEGLDGLSDAFDVCGIFEILYQDSIAQPSCPLVVIRTFTAFDSCGLNTNCTQQITVRDLTPPVITCAAPVILEGCNTGDLTALTGLDFSTTEVFIDEFTFENTVLPGQVSDNCGVLEVGYIDNIINPSCPLIIERLFTAYDSCGLTDTCTWRITIDDTTPPTIVCPDPIIGEGCSVDDVILHTTLPFSNVETSIDEVTFDNLDGTSEASDICGILEVRYIDVIVQATCPLLIDRTFTAYDSCGLTATCTQRIEIQDTEPPTIVCPNDVSGEGCDVTAVLGISGLAYSAINVIIDENTFDNLDGPSEAFDVCGILEVHYVDVIVQPSCPLLIDRTFTAYDSCGLNTSCTQRITVEDTQVPQIICPVAVDGEGCDVTAIAGVSGLVYTDVPLPVDEATFELLDVVSDAFDVCGIFEILYQDSIAQPSCPLIVIRRFTAFDSCGLSTSCTQQITVRDLTPPVIICPANVTLEGCNTGDLGTLTGLDFASVETFVDEFTFENSVLPGQVSDNCGILQVGYIDAIINPSCPLIIERLFTAYDSCGLTDTCTWRITIDDTTPPTIVCPDPVIGEGCSVDDLVLHTTLPFSPTESTIDELTYDNLDGSSEADDICGILEVRYIDVIVQQSCPLLIDRTFTTYDSCGLTATCTQRIEIQDTEPPTIVCPDDVSGEGCDVTAVLGISGLDYSSIEVTIDEITFDNLDIPSEAFDVCGILEVRYIDAIIQPSCPLLIDRTFTAYDSCGLNASCVQRIVVEDTQLPQIVCPAPVDGEGCDVTAIAGISGLPYSTSPLPVDEATFELLDGLSDAFDVCGIFEILYQDSITQPSCPLIVIRRFTAFDSCGLSTTCLQQITVRDLTPPDINCAPDVVLEGCNTGDLGVLTGLDFATTQTFIDEFTFENATLPGQVSDNCGILEIGYIDNIINPSCPLIIERLFTAYDSCGLTDTCTWRITIDDTTPPTIICPVDITYEGCSASDLINLTNLPYSPLESSITETEFNNIDATSQVNDVCGIVEVRYIDVIVQPSCPIIIDRTFTAFDSCGLNTACTQRIVIQDTQTPFLVCPDDVIGEGCDVSAVLSLSGLAYSNIDVIIDESIFDALDVPSEASDACGVAEIRYIDLIVQASCPLVIDRTFTVLDSCGLNVTCVQRITIEDTSEPEITCPGPVQGEGCDVSAIISISGLAFSSAVQPVDPIVFIGLDPLSNVSDVCGIAQLSYQDIIQEQSCPLVVLRTFTATDSCGLFTQCTQLITVHDTQNPTITCPADINVDACALDDLQVLTSLEFISIERSLTKGEFDALDGVSLAEDLCGIFEVGYIDAIVQPNCPIIVERTFTAYDSCGLTTSCVQTIQLNPIPLIDPGCPAPVVTATCLTQAEVDQLFAAWLSQFIYSGDGCFLDITSLDTVTAPEFCGGSRNITFVVEDDCGNQTSCSSSFTVPIAPELQMTCPPDIVVQCTSEIPAPYSTASQFETAGGLLSNYCGLVANSFALIDQVSDGNTCPEIITRIYEVEDFCGHIRQCSQVIIVNDTIAPVLVGVPLDVTVSCDQVPDPPIVGVEITIQDNCDQILPSFNEEVIEGVCENTYNILRSWTGVDACGNSVSAMQNITVVDCRPNVDITINPNPACLDGSVTFDAVITSNYSSPIYRWQFLWNGTWVDVPGGTTVPFTLNNVEISDAGSYRLLIADKIQNIFNFDCNVLSDEAQLDIIRPVVTDLIDTICEEEIYTVGTSSYSASGIYQDVLVAQSGCDSIVNLDLTVLANTERSLDTTICEGERLIIGETVLRNEGLYKVHLPNAAGCDSTVSVLLFVRVPQTTIIRDTICEGDTTTISGESYSEAGDYTHVLTDSYGCDSVLQISIYVIPTQTTLLNATICNGDVYNNAGQTFDTTGVYDINLTSALTGCDSIVTINLQVVDQILVTLDETICIGDSFRLGDQYYQTTGTFNQTFTSSAGCDSIVTLNLTVVTEFVTDLTREICEGESVSVGSNIYTESGNYTDLLMSSSGCDSTVNLQLLVHPNQDTLITVDICVGQSFSAGGQSFTTSGVFDITLTTVNGCDSLVRVDVTVHQGFDTTYVVNLCEGESFTIGGETYTTTGFYTQTYSTDFGCDSIINIDVKVSPRYEEDRSLVICTGSTYQVGSNTYSETGSYSDTLNSIVGCDSIIHLDLTVVDDINVDVSAQICDGDSYMFGSTSFDQSGVYTETFVSNAGCDSTVTLTLDVLTTLRDTTKETICNGEVYDFDGTPHSTEGTYEKSYSSSSGCDSIHTLILVVAPVLRPNLFHEICQGDTLIFGTKTLTQTGTYIDTLTAQSGCDSILTLNLRVNEPKTTTLNRTICDNEVFTFAGQSLDTTGIFTDTLSTTRGCDSIVILNLQVRPTFNEIVDRQICEGQIFTFNGQPISQSGQYVSTLQTRNGCDSVVTLNLSVLNVLKDTTYASICGGDPFTFAGIEYTQQGSYNLNYTSAAGCDSIHTLILDVQPVQRTNLEAEICDGEMYQLGTKFISTDGIFSDTLTSVSGCDSIVSLTLRVNATKSTNITRQICAGETFDFHGLLLDSSGVYLDTLISSAGCDSVVTLSLTVHPVYFNEISIQICVGQSYGFDGQSLTVSGDYTANLMTKAGCDSTVLLHLAVVDVITTDLTEVTCEGSSMDFFGQVLTTPGNYTHTLTSTAGCDSIINLTLTWIDVITVDEKVNICEGEIFQFGDTLLTESGIYVDTLVSKNGCDSIVTIDLSVGPVFQDTVNAQICLGTIYPFAGQDLSESGIYFNSLQTAAGCDSVIVLNLLVDDIKRDTLYMDVCPGETVLFEGEEYTSSGVYEKIISGIECDTNKVLVLNVLDEMVTTVNKQICIGESYMFDGQELATSGGYSATLTSNAGCDSTVNLVLEMVEAIHTNLDYFICTGDSVVVNDIAYYEAGTYSDTMVSAGGCDSVIFINISQATQKFVILEDTICEGSGFNFGGNVYTESTSFVDTIPSLSGCDSIVQVNLVVLPKYESEVFVSICTGTSYTHDGVVYDMEGVYELSYTSNQGCDSIIHLNVVVVDQIYTELIVQNCTGGTFDFNGTTITEAGTYRDTLTSVNGCDSIVSLQFELHDIIQTFQNYTICSGDSILINGQVYSEATIFSDTSISIMGCDSVAHHEVVLVSDIALTGGSAVICPGEEVQLSVTVEGDLLGLVNWTPKEDLSCSDCLDPIASPPNTTTYEITTMGCLGSEIRAEYQVEVVPLPELSIIQNPGPNGGQEVVLSATTIDPQHNINWYDESGELICANCTSIVQTVLGDQTFVASAANSLGCEVTEEISVSINTENQCDVGSIIASNAMTPNGDGSNDQFQIINSSDAEITLVQVLNRWGETVFESHGIEDLWDGTVRGNPVNPGVYVYMIFGICTEGDFQLVGNVTVIR